MVFWIIVSYILIYQLLNKVILKDYMDRLRQEDYLHGRDYDLYDEDKSIDFFDRHPAAEFKYRVREGETKKVGMWENLNPETEFIQKINQMMRERDEKKYDTIRKSWDN